MLDGQSAVNFPSIYTDIYLYLDFDHRSQAASGAVSTLVVDNETARPGIWVHGCRCARIWSYALERPAYWQIEKMVHVIQSRLRTFLSCLSA
jgi:hypothetical protein